MKTFEELLNCCTNKKIYECAQQREAKIRETSIEEVRTKIKATLDVMKDSVKNGLQNESLSVTGKSGNLAKKLKTKRKNSFLSEVNSKIVLYSIAVMEENLRMGKIAACPTAGSCGIVPACVLAFSEAFNIDEEKQINALITAGEIGRIINQKLSLAGAVAGCQAECGVATAMAAGALTELNNGSTTQILNSAALALKNCLGLSCDPVAGMVEIPCIKRNAFMATAATVAAELALCEIESAICLDEVTDAMVQTGQLMSPLLKESSLGGLATTKTGLEIAQKLKDDL